MRDGENIRKLDELRLADWMGFIFFPPSSRNVSEVPQYLPEGSKRVGVFVNEGIDSIKEKIEQFGFNLVQLHGDETPDFCRELRTAINCDIQLIKMIQISGDDDLLKVKAYDGLTDYFLFETKCSGYGGSGRQFDWDILQKYDGTTPFLITGGITSDDAEKIRSFQHPQFAGIDLNSKFEVAPALKDIDLLRNFIKQIKR